MRPILFSLGSFDFFASPIFAGLSAALAAFYLYRRKEAASLDDDLYWKFMLFLSVGTMAAGVLAYFFLYGGGVEKNVAFLLKHHRIRGGSYYGNYWGAALSAFIFSRAYALSFRKLADLIGAAAPLGLSLMRLGCLQHGCCFGAPFSGPWAILFTDPRSAVRRSLLGTYLHPSQLYEAVANILLFLLLQRFAVRAVREGRLPDGSVFLLSTASYALIRFSLDFSRASDPGILSLFGLSTAQAAAAASLGVTAVLARRWTRPIPG